MSSKMGTPLKLSSEKILCSKSALKSLFFCIPAIQHIFPLYQLFQRVPLLHGGIRQKIRIHEPAIWWKFYAIWLVWLRRRLWVRLFRIQSTTSTCIKRFEAKMSYDIAVILRSFHLRIARSRLEFNKFPRFAAVFNIVARLLSNNPIFRLSGINWT